MAVFQRVSTRVDPDSAVMVPVCSVVLIYNSLIGNVTLTCKVNVTFFLS